ncbi:hypothetical protein PPACK8108_LOCUS3652 [Phakopsora pachyrhizi]|uniref:Uncharacterized protein n=1 Tax=Phakopsora pachyrhizi TaxID=170000 RepID=A0AAV0AN57_PHAPC|nr:hypothetical protein PPACK8108_LOCUS3652 [Phakopsora pachyrhizi]
MSTRVAGQGRRRAGQAGNWQGRLGRLGVCQGRQLTGRRIWLILEKRHKTGVWLGRQAEQAGQAFGGAGRQAGAARQSAGWTGRLGRLGFCQGRRLVGQAGRQEDLADIGEKTQKVGVWQGREARAGQAGRLGRLGVRQGRQSVGQGRQAGNRQSAGQGRVGRQEDLADIGEKTQKKNQYSPSEYLDDKDGQLLISSKSHSCTSTGTPSKSSTAHKSAVRETMSNPPTKLFSIKPGGIAGYLASILSFPSYVNI